MSLHRNYFIFNLTEQYKMQTEVKIPTCDFKKLSSIMCNTVVPPSSFHPVVTFYAASQSLANRGGWRRKITVTGKIVAGKKRP
jgi:hypothetical protein